jgi:peptidoglycan/LPS O-acetylase OafA/YrhL
MFLGLDPVSGHLFFTADYRTTSPELFRFLFVPQAWTIGLELLFYLVAPFIVRRNMKVVAGLIVICLVARGTVYKCGLHHDPWTGRFFPLELVFFLFGNISYSIYAKIRTWRIKTSNLNILWVAAILASVFFSTVNIPFQKDFYYLCFCLALPFIFLRTKNLRIDSYIGELSYPLYVSHMFVLYVMQWLSFSSGQWLAPTLTVAAILFSVALNWLVAKPVENLRQRRVQNATRGSDAVSVGLL